FRDAIRLNPKDAVARNNLRFAERLRRLLPRLPDIAAGRADPESPAEAIAFATLCAQPFQRPYPLPAPPGERACAPAPSPAPLHRYNAACCAAQAGAGKAKDGDSLSPADRAALRGKALTWLRADLAVRQKQAASPDPAQRKQAAAALAHWLRYPDLD